MKMSEFKYNLPEELIAQYPPKERGSSSLLVLEKNTRKLEERKYSDIPEYIQEGDVVVLNETKVLNCRTYFLTSGGKRVEILFLEEIVEGKWFALIGRAKHVSEGDILSNEKDDTVEIEVGERKENGFFVKFVKGLAFDLFEKHGHTPLPPYMKREDEKEDRDRYNTVFSAIPGAVAAPTASLNLTDKIVKAIEKKGGKIIKVELKVGWGTFAPIREENIEEHKMHKEYISIDEQSAATLNKAILENSRVWSFGTTVARTLESIAFRDDESGKYLVKSFKGETDLYIYPGYEWKVVDILITNFHMPDSSLILLVSSFAGRENIKKAYEYAVKKRYKFLSYGDSMIVGDNLLKTKNKNGVRHS